MGRFEVTIGLIGIIALVTTLAISFQWNPWPAVYEWMQRTQKLSTPATAWTVSAGGRPSLVSIVDTGQIVVVIRGRVEAHDPSTGVQLWSQKAEWARPAGQVVVIGNPTSAGYSVLRASTGQVLWGNGSARAAWAYRDKVVELSCADAKSCVLRGREPVSGGPLWSVALPGDGLTIRGGNPDLPDLRALPAWFDDAAAGAATDAPVIAGYPFGGTILVVDLVSGTLLRRITPPDRQTRVIVGGGRVIYATARRQGSTCLYTVRAVDWETNEPRWQIEGYDFGMISGTGCELRRDPGGGRSVVAAVRPDGRPVLLDLANGLRDGETWVGEDGEQVLATDGELAVIGVEGHKAVKVVDLANGNRVVATPEVGPATEAAITPYAIFLHDPRANKLLVLSRRTNIMANLATTALVAGYGATGVVLSNGRTIGVYRWTQGL